MKQRLVTILLSIVALSAAAKVTLGFPGEDAAMVGIYVKDLKTNNVVAENFSDKALMTASVMKAVTAASVMTTTDKGFTYKTNVYYTGNIIDGICSGDIIIVGSGDPTVESSMFPKTTSLTSCIISSLKDKGVNTINGHIIVEDNLSDAGCIPRWEIDDVPWAYGAGYYGFNFHDNAFDLWPAIGKSSPHVPDLEMKLQYANSGDLQRGIFSNDLYVYGPINNKAWNFETSMNNPAQAYEYNLAEKIKESGIAVLNENCDNEKRSILVQYQSPALYDILNQMLVHSHNMYAEAMLRLLAPGESRDNAIAKEVAIWKSRGIKTDYNRICDGSGLARSDRLSPKFIGDILSWMANSAYADSYVNLLPKVGMEGTVASFLKGTKLHGKMALKTGSMQGVQCYAGYKLDSEGKPTHVVVILINTFFCDRTLLRSKIQQFLLNTF